METIQIASASRARLRALIAAYETEGTRRQTMFNKGTYAAEDTEASRDLQAMTAASIVGLLQGLGLDR